jgi:hypothetical protein
MRRDEKLIKLSREHYASLKLANSLASAPVHTISESLSQQVKTARIELSAHFKEEEETLIPQLLSYGEFALTNRLKIEHQQLLSLSGDETNSNALKQFGLLLKAHARFEERELFTVLQAHWEAQP